MAAMAFGEPMSDKLTEKITKHDIVDKILEKLPGKPTKYKVQLTNRLEPIVVWESDLKKNLGKELFKKKLDAFKKRGAAEAMKRVEQQTHAEDWSGLEHAELETPPPNLFEGGSKSRKKKRTRRRKRKTKRKRKKRRKTRKRKRRKSKKRRR
jgi:hypothetical protein